MKGDGEVLRAVTITKVKTEMRKRASTAPITAPATVMELDLSARDWSEVEEREEKKNPVQKNKAQRTTQRQKTLIFVVCT